MSNKAEKRGLVPKLRFPEFREAGEWEMKELRKVAAILNKKAGSNQYRLMSITAGVGLVSQLEKFGREIAGAQYKNYLVIEKNDFAYNKSATKEYPEGFIGMYSGNKPGAVPNSIFTCFRVDTSTVSPKYLDYLFIGNLHGKWLKKFITVGARAHGSLNINDNDLLALPVPFPKGDHLLLEQQKIADCLASLDELITLEVQQLDTLKTHKKRLMQQLFPAEGETLPKLRFPEFRDAGEWEEKSIQELIDSKIVIGHLDGNHGELYPRSDEFSEKGIPYITANDFASGSVDFSKCKYLPEHRAKLFKKGIAKNGDILFAHNATVGPVAPLKTDLDFVILSTTATYYRCDNLRLINDFLQFELCCPFFVGQYTRVMKQSTRNQVPITTQRQFKLVLPERKEQRKIADCLTSLDDLITAQTQKLAALKAHKKGLMQQLFPVVNEVDA